jgi:endoglucanase
MMFGPTLFSLCLLLSNQSPEDAEALRLNELDYFETRGLNVLVFSNWYNDLFSDSKMSGIELIHHGVRTATNGDVRLNPTPEQWNPIPQFVERRIDRDAQTIEASLRYPAYNFTYAIKAESREGGIVVSVILEQPLPQALEGRAGFNLEFLPSAYFTKAYLMDGRSGLFPLCPGGPMEKGNPGLVEPKPIATGNSLVLAPEDPARRVMIQSRSGDLMLFDGRNQAQNGWFVVRSILPARKTGRVIEWLLTAGTIPGWRRPPVIAHSQVGYHPDQKKIAVIELDNNDHSSSSARVLRISDKGEEKEVFKSDLRTWGRYLRYTYATFDFTPITESGLYIIECGDERTAAVRISRNVYESAWHPTLDVFFPVQMDHMYVREAYRVWHGASHLDDALQAPLNHEHFDLYAQGPTTDTQYKPGEHIPGVNVGGWFDAGDFDLRTQSQYATVLSMVQTWETFRPERDETSINQHTRSVDIHRPDGQPDLLQQIEHGTLQLVAQHKAIGHALPGIIDAHLSQYTHLGDAVTQTDNLVYTPALDGGEPDGFTSGRFDDRWAFTSRSSALNYGSIAALAAAARALHGYNDTLASECLSIATRVWAEEHSHPPYSFQHGNTTGGPLEDEELRAAVELLICSREKRYAQRIISLWPHIESNFDRLAAIAVRAVPFMGEQYTRKIEPLVRKYKERGDKFSEQNPFGVPISTGGWAGNGLVAGFANTSYILHKAFPNIVGSEFTLRGLGYLFGCHPASALSFVSGVGADSKRVAYGNNRADYSFIAGGVVPGVLIVHPDFPENKEDWPFLWGENEYVITLAASYLYLVHAANDLVNEESGEPSHGAALER